MKKILLTAVLSLIGIHTVTAQVGIGTETPEASAVLEIKSASKGFLPPRLTEIQRDSFNNPATGLWLWCSNCGTDGQLQVYNGIAWTNLRGTTATGANDFFNPKTEQTWMDRNLGASQVAGSRTDTNAYGDLYQWGRAADGHEDRNSTNYEAVKSTDGVANFNNDPANAWHGYFILRDSGLFNWVDPSVTGVDDLWIGSSGTNNPCPSGYRIPSVA